jgi:hypothetical protein
MVREVKRSILVTAHRWLPDDGELSVSHLGCQESTQKAESHRSAPNPQTAPGNLPNYA